MPNHYGSVADNPGHALRLGDLLVDIANVARADVESAAQEAKATQQPLGHVLLERGLVLEPDLYQALALLNGLPFSRVSELLRLADRSITGSIPRRYLQSNELLPIGKRNERTAIVETSNPTPVAPGLADALDAERLEFILVTPTDLRRLALALRIGARVQDGNDSGPKAGPRDLLGPEGDEIANVSLFDAIMLDAIAERASDIHLECHAARVRVRLRVDGKLFDASKFDISPEQHQAIVNIIKVRAKLDISEHRLPQGGRFTTVAGGRVFDLRVQTQPALYGEHVVIRLLSKEMELRFISELGLSPAVSASYERLLRSPAGLILVVGPTGSGKSTTLYAGLNILAHDTGRKVITVEDPVECPIADIQQTQINSAAGFHFVDAMRAFVREDPDVIMLGEIRDQETALEALRASQTGHLVLSTLHCNDSVDAVQRLFDLGMHPNTIAAELLAVFAQRLARRICTYCRQPHQPDPALLRDVFGALSPPDLSCFRGEGCHHCNGRGHHGRIAIVEHLPAGPTLRRAISRQLPLDDLRGVAYDGGLVTMRQHALNLVKQGVIALEELPRIFTPEQLSGMH